jgi:HK97 family phage major capsid protein
MDYDENDAIDSVLDDCEQSASPPPSALAIGTTWARFQSVNDQRLRDGDPLHDVELRRLNAELDGLAIENKAMRAPRGRPTNIEREAIVAIGKEVLQIGRKVNGMRSAPAGAGGISAARKAAYGRFTDLAEANHYIAHMEAKRNRPPGMGARTLPGLAGAGGRSGRNLAGVRYKAAINHWLRTGDEHYDGEHIRGLMRKAMHTELNPAGGYIALADRDNNPLDTFLTELSPMRQRASIRQIAANSFTRVTRLSGASARWSAERTAPTATDTPTLGEDIVTPMRLEAYPAASQDLLDDASIDVEAWLAEEVALAFAELESDAWFNGNGVTQPRGLLTYDFVTPASWAHGKFRYVLSGAAGAFLPTAPTASPPTMPGDALLDMAYTLKQGYRTAASWMFNRSTIGEIRKLKDAQGRYLWQESMQNGQPPMLLGFPVDEDEFMPEIGADTMSIGFGDWKKTYEIVDRIGVRVLRDPYTSKPNVVFFTTKRVGGSVKNFDAAVFMKFAAA